MSLTIELGITSSDAIALNLSYNSRFEKKQIRSELRTKSGNLYTYKWGDFRRFKFRADFMQSTDAAVVNSWWDTNTKLLVFVTSDSTTEVFSVMIMNDESPMSRMRRPYYTLFRGTLNLETY